MKHSIETRTDAAHFAPTNLLVSLDPQRQNRPVFIPSAEAKGWDGALDGTNCTLLSPAHDVQCYAELRITGRKVRRHPGGMVGLKGRVRFRSEYDTAAEWHDVVVMRREA